MGGFCVKAEAEGKELYMKFFEELIFRSWLEEK
jgi:hypothetical protein